MWCLHLSSIVLLVACFDSGRRAEKGLLWSFLFLPGGCCWLGVFPWREKRGIVYWKIRKSLPRLRHIGTKRGFCGLEGGSEEQHCGTVCTEKHKRERLSDDLCGFSFSGSVLKRRGGCWGERERVGRLCHHGSISSLFTRPTQQPIFPLFFYDFNSIPYDPFLHVTRWRKNDVRTYSTCR